MVQCADTIASEVDTNIQVAAIRDMRINGEPTEFEILENEPDRFVLSFPLIDGDGDLLEFAFDLPIFRFGSTFSGRAYNSLWPTVPQILEPGNAVSFVLMTSTNLQVWRWLYRRHRWVSS